jgi:DNA-binding transcriptional ArsR family regulator
MARNPVAGAPQYSGYLPTALPSPVGEHTERFLRENRLDINERVAREVRRSSQVRPDDVLAFIRCDLEPVLEAVATFNEASISTVANTAFDLAFDAIGRRLLGPRAIHPGVIQLWRALPQLGQHLADDPESLVSDLHRAAIFLAAHPNLRNAHWASQLGRIGSRCASPNDVRKVGQVLAWTQGLPQYRHSATAIADQLPADIALACVEAATGLSWDVVRDHLRADRWFRPDGTSLTDHGLVETVGSFSGFDGHFPHPPLVAIDGTSLITWAPPPQPTIGVGTSDALTVPVWHLLADAYGSAFIRSKAQPQIVTVALPPNCTLDAGILSVNSERIDLRATGAVTSVAVLGRTLALTTQRSFRVKLIRLPA